MNSEAEKAGMPYILADPKVMDMEDFGMHIYIADNVGKIGGIVIDQTRIDKLKKLNQEMKLYYNNEESDPDAIIIGKYYAVFDDDWHRVQCLSCCFKDQTATVLFIDRGDQDVVFIENLQILPSKFCQLPIQCITISLNGLEIFQDFDGLQTLQDLLLDEDVFVKVSEAKLEDDIPILSAQIFVEKETENLNVNDLVLDEILNLIDPVQILENSKVTQQVQISYVNKEVLFVQIKSQGLIYLENIISDYIEKCGKHSELKKTDDLQKHALYLTKNQNDKWCRFRVLYVKDKEVEVLFVDTGKIQILKDTIVILVDDTHILSGFPEQAIKVILHKISPAMYSDNVVSFIRQLADSSSVLYMKVLGDDKKIPIVQLIRRAEDNRLVSVNDSLPFDSPLQNIDKTLTKSLKLKSPNLPKEGSYFDVYVTMANHPDNLIVQPRSYLKQLEKLMADLLEDCESFSGPHLTYNDIKVGCFYAVLSDEDDTWFRAYVYNIMSETCFAVYACDYGNFTVVKLTDMQPLAPKYYDLPWQAMKAKLMGVDPNIKENWCIYDCVAFNELIVCKSLMALVGDHENDKSTLNGVALNLVLIDTETEEDIFLADKFNEMMQ